MVLSNSGATAFGHDYQNVIPKAFTSNEGRRRSFSIEHSGAFSVDKAMANIYH